MEELRARDESLIPSEITADEYIDTDESLLTFETFEMTDDEILTKMANPKEGNEEKYEENNVIEDVIQLPTKYEVMRALEVLQTCTFYGADNLDEMRAKVNAFSKQYDISMNKAKTQKALTDFFVHNEHKL